VSDSDVVIEMKDVVKRFGDQTVLDGVNIEVRRGETVVIMGGSGCGKSTTLRIMIGSLIPEEGHVQVLGKDIAILDENELNGVRKRFGILFQSGALFNSMTVAENVSLILEEHTDLDASIIDMMVKIKLELVDLREAAEKYPAQISGGMKKRAGLARALALDPEILFYDEPSAGLDPVTSASIDQLMIDLTKRLGVASVVVTHEMDSAFTIADRMVMLHQGRVLMNAPRADFEALRDWPEDRLGELNENQQLIRQFLRGAPEGPMTEHAQGADNSYAADLLGIDNSKLTGGRSVQSTRGVRSSGEVGFWQGLFKGESKAKGKS
jgi:phospholipid/cholesterol/gamma-HCH transport system ATP-binding protein|tara:strand:+ start:1456 stop:2424 length:969 start_codon:yes stop_codon:yes gene_type:complete